MDGCGLACEIVRHGRTISLVFLIEVMTESFTFGIEYTGSVGCGIIFFKTVQHIQKTVYGAGRFAFGIAQIRQGMVGTIEIA